jgi:hypothetical protein
MLLSFLAPARVKSYKDEEEAEKMDCLDAVAPSDEELLDFALDAGELPPEQKEHLEHCETCQRRLARYQQANNYLVSHLYRSQCPSGTKLSFYCAGGLAAHERMQIAQHLLDCPLCAEEVADTRRFMQQVPVFEPISPFSPRQVVRRIFATLVRQQAQLVVRGETPSSAWPRQYRAESLDLSLHLSRGSRGNYMLLGILTSANAHETIDAFEGACTELYTTPGPFIGEGNKESEKPVLTTEVDDLGNIVFSDVPVGEYVMVLRLANREVVVEGLTIDHG